MSRLARAAALFSLGPVALALACTTHNSSSVSLEQACFDYAHAYRAREATCYGVAPAPNQTDLIARQASACALNSAAPGSRLDAHYWESCASSVGTNCAAYSCGVYPSGARPDGDPCSTSSQCQSLWCRGTQALASSGAIASNAIQCGACAARLTTGAPCGPLDACPIGTSCTGGACQPQGGPGSACTKWADCAFPSACRAGVCGQPAFSGDACDLSSDCTTDTGCDLQTKVCAPIQFGPPGAACDHDVKRCEAGSCNIAAPATTGTCPAVVPDGTKCDPNDSSTVCDDYARCFRGTCQIVDPVKCG